jgi:hypothetical protein
LGATVLGAKGEVLQKFTVGSEMKIRGQTSSLNPISGTGTQAADLFLLAFFLLRPALIRASRVLPSTPPLFHCIERHFLEGQFGGFSVSGIHRCSQTSQYGSRLTTPQKVYWLTSKKNKKSALTAKGLPLSRRSPF